MQKSKFFFFSFLIFLFLMPISYFSIKGNAIVSSSNLTIKSDWLYEEEGIFQDRDPKSWENKYYFSLGGEDLLSFENLGIIAANGTHLLYKSIVQFGFEATAHINVGFQNNFPEMNRNEQHTEEFFTIFTDKVIWEHYSVTWSTINYGDTRTYHEYDGVQPITVGIKELIPPSGVISLNGISFSIPEYKYNILQVQVAEVRDGEVGDYTDYFTNAGQVAEGSVEIVALDDDFNREEVALIGFYNSADLGWDEGPIERGETLQQSVVSTAQVGSTFHNINSELNKPFKFNLPVTLVPETYEFVQYNKIRKASIDYWTWGFWAGDIFPWYGPASINAPKRTVAVHTTNPFIHWDFIIDLEFYAMIPSTAQLTESILADPYLKKGDMVWDTSFTGVYDVQKPATQQDDFFEWLSNLFGGFLGGFIMILIIGLGLYLVYRFVIKKRTGGAVTIINK